MKMGSVDGDDPYAVVSEQNVREKMEGEEGK